MTFSYPDADLGQIIKSYRANGDNYHIEYLDGSVNDYICSDKDEERKILGIMFEQAIKRQEMFNEDDYNFKTELWRAVKISGLVSFALSFTQKHFTASLITILLTLFASQMKYANNTVKKELYKYKYFLEMVKDKNYSDNPEIEDETEFDKIYYSPININTLDNYEYSDIKRIYKKYKKREK